MFLIKVVEKIKIHILFCNIFPKTVLFMRYVEKMWWSRRGRRWQYNTAALCMLNNYGYTRASTRPRPCTHPHTDSPTPTHTRTHTDQYVMLIAFPLQQWLRERASTLRYTHIACLITCRYVQRFSNRRFTSSRKWHCYDSVLKAETTHPRSEDSAKNVRPDNVRSWRALISPARIWPAKIRCLAGPYRSASNTALPTDRGTATVVHNTIDCAQKVNGLCVHSAYKKWTKDSFCMQATYCTCLVTVICTYCTCLVTSIRTYRTCRVTPIRTYRTCRVTPIRT